MLQKAAESWNGHFWYSKANQYYNAMFQALRSHEGRFLMEYANVNPRDVPPMFVTLFLCWSVFPGAISPWAILFSILQFPLHLQTDMPLAACFFSHLCTLAACWKVTSCSTRKVPQLYSHPFLTTQVFSELWERKYLKNSMLKGQRCSTREQETFSSANQQQLLNLALGSFKSMLKQCFFPILCFIC